MNAAPRRSLRRTLSFSSLPIRGKLLVVIVGICAGALLLSALLETAFYWRSERAVLINRLEVTAEMLALQSRAALEFLDPAAARENLAALQGNPTILHACLYNEAGAEFAVYTVPGQNPVACPPPQREQTILERNRFELFHDVMHNDRKIGTLFLERDMSDIYERFTLQVIYKLAIVLFVSLLVWPLSAYFRRLISQPIMQLADITRRFSQDRSQPFTLTARSDDELGELVKAFREMTEDIRGNEQQLSQAITELTRSNTELERFAHICSHDLQEPLRMISNYAALLEKRCKDRLDEETGQYLHFITDGAVRMRELINDILSYARISHHVEPMQAVELNALVEHALKNLSASIGERQARIHTPGLPEITGNRTLLLQIFQNLLSNAVKFCTGVPEIWIEAKRGEGEWIFSVRDNGIGIDPRYHDKIFEIFKRLNRREEFRGTGIGLAIFKKAVEYHNGRVWVESEPGKGTAFFFTVPDQEKKGENYE